MGLWEDSNGLSGRIYFQVYNGSSGFNSGQVFDDAALTTPVRVLTTDAVTLRFDVDANGATFKVNGTQKYLSAMGGRSSSWWLGWLSAYKDVAHWCVGWYGLYNPWPAGHTSSNPYPGVNGQHTLGQIHDILIDFA